jgi:transcription termination factor NusB
VRDDNEGIVSFHYQPTYYRTDLRGKFKTLDGKTVSPTQQYDKYDTSLYEKDVDKNLTSIMAILYRPLKNNNIKDGKFIVKSTYKALKHDVENIFDYYEVEDYDVDKRKQRTTEFESFPLEVAMGGLSFFLHCGATLLTNTETYSPNTMQQYKTEMSKMSKIKRALLRIMVGSTSSTNLVKRPSYILQETGVSLI